MEEEKRMQMGENLFLPVAKEEKKTEGKDWEKFSERENEYKGSGSFFIISK